MGTLLAALSDFKSDCSRYPRRAWLHDRGFWGVAFYRLSRAVFLMARSRNGLIAHAGAIIVAVLEYSAQLLTGVELRAATEIGRGLCIYHGGNLVVNPGVRIGVNCTLRQGVTIGNLKDAQTPIIGNDVEFGAYAQVLGGIKVGDGARIGAMAVVLSDVPESATAVGNPARIVPRK